MFGLRSGHQNALHPANTGVERAADGERGSGVGGSPSWDWLQRHRCCSRFIGQNLVSRPPCPAAREAGHCGLAVAQEERGTDSGALTLPATPSLSLGCRPQLHPGALLAPVVLSVFRARWLSHRPAWALRLALCFPVLRTPVLSAGCLAGLASPSLQSPSNPPCPAHVSGPGPSDPWQLPALTMCVPGWEPV